MASKKKAREDEIPQRPFCASCGDPKATHKLEVALNELVLERDAGLHARPHWSPRYNFGARIESLLCASCVKTHVQVSVAASASVTKKDTSS